MFEALKISRLEIAPTVQRRHFSEPPRGQARHTAGHATIFLVVRENAAFGEGAEAVIILIGERLVVWINCEHGFHRGVSADPGESLQPAVAARDERKFQMWRRGNHP